MPYISITGLQLKSKRHLIKFWWHAIRSMRQAKRAQGNISTDVKILNGVHHTLSVWTNEQDMRAFLTTGPHLAAIKSFHTIATGKTYGYNSEQIPNWDLALDLWDKKGKKF